MEINAKIISYLDRAREDVGSVLKLSNMLGVRNTTVRNWLNGTTRTISDACWGRVLRFLRPYIPVAEYNAYLTEYNRPRAQTLVNDYLRSSQARSEVAAVENDDSKFFPVISDAAAASVNTLYYPLSEYASANSDDRQYFSNGRPGDFVIQVSGESMLPWYPPGTLLLVRPYQRLENGNRVIAILDSGEIVFKVFVERNGKCGLLSINDHDGVNFIFKGGDRQNIRDIYKVVGSARDEDRLDKEMAERGMTHRWEETIKDW